jgi:hypothetical protein
MYKLAIVPFLKGVLVKKVLKKKKGVKTSIRILMSDELKSSLKHLAVDREMSLCALCVEIFKEYFNELDD